MEEGVRGRIKRAGKVGRRGEKIKVIFNFTFPLYFTKTFWFGNKIIIVEYFEKI